MNSPHRPLYSDWRLLTDTPLLLDCRTDRSIFLMDSLSDMLVNTDWNQNGTENMNQWGLNCTSTPATSEGSIKRRCCCTSKALKTVSRALSHHHLEQAMLSKCYVSSNCWGQHDTEVSVPGLPHGLEVWGGTSRFKSPFHRIITIVGNIWKHNKKH